MTQMLDCDYCHKHVPEQGHLGWFALDVSGIDIRPFSEPPGPWHFCSLKCIASWAQERRGQRLIEVS